MVGVIGIGLLGTALVERLQQAGFEIVGFDADAARTEWLRNQDGRAVESAVDVVRQCRRTVLALPDSTVVQNVLEQIESSLTADSLLVDTTTGDPEFSAEVGRRLIPFGVRYVDATVVGSSEQVRNGDAIMLAGGEAGAIESATDLLEACSRRWFHVGPSGSGARAKLVVNLVLGLHRAVLAEGLSLAKASGLELNQTLEILRAGASYSAVMDTKGPKMISGDFSAQARLAQHRKDVELILKLADRHHIQLPLSTVHRELLNRAIELGYGTADNSAILKAFE